MSEHPIGRPSDKVMREYLDGEHGPPHPEVVAIIQDDLDRAIRSANGPVRGPHQPECDCPPPFVDCQHPPCGCETCVGRNS